MSGTPAGMSPKEALESIEKLVEVYQKAIKAYDETVDSIVGWKQFKDAISDLNKRNTALQNVFGQLVEDCNVKILNAETDYNASVRSVYTWCGTTEGQLRMLIKVLTMPKVDETMLNAAVQVTKKTLESGKTILSEAMNHLLTSSKSFNECIAKIARMKEDSQSKLNDTSKWYTDAVDDIRKKAYASAVAGAVFGPLGIAISYATAAGVVEGQLIPELKRRMEDTKNYINQTLQKVSDLGTRIDTSVKRLDDEMNQVKKLQIGNNVLATSIDLAEIELLRSDVVKDAQTLQNLCSDYMKRHQ